MTKNGEMLLHKFSDKLIFEESGKKNTVNKFVSKKIQLNSEAALKKLFLIIPS